MGKPGLGIKKTVKKYSTPHEVIRFDRDTTEYIDGILQSVESERETIKIFTEPIGEGKLIRDLPEGQRLSNVRRGYTLDVINEKDKLIEDGVFFTVNAALKYPLSGHTECDLLRTGEQDNIVE